MKLSTFLLMLFVACDTTACSATTKPPAEKPGTDWLQVLKDVATMGLQAAICPPDVPKSTGLDAGITSADAGPLP